MLVVCPASAEAGRAAACTAAHIFFSSGLNLCHTISFKTMKRSLLIITVFVSIVFGARAWYMRHQFVIPALHQRAAGLQPEEFKRQQQRYDLLVQSISKAPAEVKNYAALAKLFMTEARVSGDHPYYYPAAMCCLDEALRRKPNNIEASMLKTSVLLSLHHFAEARALAKDLSANNPTISGLYGMLCDANVELGNLDEAVSDVDAMMRLRPGLEAYARAAYLREIHGDVDGALDAMSLAAQAGLSGSEEAAWTRCTLGTMYLKYNRLDEAERCFEQTLAERKSYPSALAGLAMVWHKKSKDGAALALLDSALTLQPEVLFVEHKAEIMADLGMTHERDSLESVMESMLDQDEAAGHFNHAERAISYCRLHYKPLQALAHARLEIAQRPNNMTAQYAMAFALHCNGMDKEALQFMTKALHSGTHDSDMMACSQSIQSSLAMQSGGSGK